MKIDLHENPHVLEMSEILGVDCLHVVGMLWRVWSWADAQSVSGNAVRVTEVTLDRFAQRVGFAAALRKVGWLEGRDNALTFPRFAEHNGQTAKARALTAKRVSKHESGKANAKLTLHALADKIREDKNTETPLPPSAEGGACEGAEKPPALAKPPKPPPAKPVQLLRAERLMRRRPETPPTSAEERAWQKNRAAVEATTEPDWSMLERFYAAPQSQTYSRKDLATLLNNWNGEIERARAWIQRAEHPQAPEGGRRATFA